MLFGTQIFKTMDIDEKNIKQSPVQSAMDIKQMVGWNDMYRQQAFVWNAAHIMLEFGLPPSSSDLTQLPYWKEAKELYGWMKPTYKRMNFAPPPGGELLWELAQSLMQYDPSKRASVIQVYIALEQMSSPVIPIPVKAL
jgi:hypothetical protein